MNNEKLLVNPNVYQWEHVLVASSETVAMAEKRERVEDLSTIKSSETKHLESKQNQRLIKTGDWDDTKN